MRQPLYIGVTALALAALPGAIGYRTILNAAADPAVATQAPPKADRVARGKYLVDAMGCHDCHTPWTMGPQGPHPDMTRALTGHPAGMVMPAPPKLPEGPWVALIGATNTAFAGPWGVSFTANLTPDKETGLGRWTDEMFIAALRTGRHEGKGRPILPPMPWSMIRNLNDGDLRAIFSYLQSLPPVNNRVPQPIDPPESK
jgi:mono/diheme cytochrome c family protein